MSQSKRLKAQQEKHVEEELAEKEEKASSAMKMAMDVLDRGLEEARTTHRTAKKLRASVVASTRPLHLAVVKK